MGLLTLAAEKGSVISIKITGEDEKVLEEKLKSLVNNYFGEGIKFCSILLGLVFLLCNYKNLFYFSSQPICLYVFN